MINNISNKFSKQRGIALLFALAILALLLVMAVSFTTDSIFEQKSAANTASTTAARFLAEAEITKITALLNMYSNGICWSSDGTVGDSNNDNLNRLQTMDGGSYIFKWEPIYTNRIKWQEIKINVGTITAPDYRIVGRTAYVLVLDPGIDPGALVSKTADESAYPEKRIGVDVNEINIRSIDPAKIDVTMARTFNWNLMGGSYVGMWVDFPNLFSKFSPALTAALENDFRKWFIIDPPPDKEAFWIDLNGDEVVDDGTDLTKPDERFGRFNLARTDWDSFVNPPTGHPAFPNSDMYRDILLDSNGDGVPDIRNALKDSDGDGIPDTTPEVKLYSINWENILTNGVGIQWLALFGYDKDGQFDNDNVLLKGTFNKVVDIKRQIAANLVDYCDTDSVPTSDQAANSWTTSADPKYTGNERTPYINELGFKVNVDVAFVPDNTSTPKTRTATVNYDVKAIAELIDIYETSYADDLDLLIKGLTITMQVTVGASAPVTVVVTPGGGDMVFNGANRIVPGNWANGYAFKLASVNNGSTSITVNDEPTNSNNYITNVSVTSVSFNRAVLYKSGDTTKCYDFVKGLSATPNIFAAKDVIVDTPALGTCMTFETYDPHQNLNPADWTFKGSDLKPNLEDVLSVVPDGMGGYFGKVNSVSSPVGAYNSDSEVVAGNPENSKVDKETTPDPAVNLSTAFIRNGPMESPWEIGFIHRGVKWQTINLKRYDKNKVINAITTATGKYNAGGGSYELGDANILDQIKMTDKSEVSKIQTKTRMPEALTALFDKIRLGCVPDATMSVNSMSKTTGTELSVADVEALQKKVIEKDIVLLTRAGLADIPEFSSVNWLKTLQRDTDAKQEELIGKVVNLADVTAKQQAVYGNRIRYFTIVVIAQSIKDVGGLSTATNGIDIIKKDKDGDTFSFDVPNANPTPATPHAYKAKFGTIDFIDTGKTHADGSKIYLYADEITGEQKIKVRGYRDDMGKVHIFSYEYVE